MDRNWRIVISQRFCAIRQKPIYDGSVTFSNIVFTVFTACTISQGENLSCLFGVKSQSFEQIVYISVRPLSETKISGMPCQANVCFLRCITAADVVECNLDIST